MWVVATFSLILEQTNFVSLAGSPQILQYSHYLQIIF